MTGKPRHQIGQRRPSAPAGSGPSSRGGTPHPRSPCGRRCSAQSPAATTASTASVGPATTVWRGEAYTATVTSGKSAINASVAAASSSSRAIAPVSAQPGHQLRPRGDHPEPLGRGQRPGHHRRGHLAHRMPDHRIGFHPVGAPQRGQRQLDTDQHRLDLLDAGQLLPVGEHVVQREPDLGDEIRLQRRRRPRRTPARRRAAAGPCRPTGNPGRNRRTRCPDRTVPGAGRPRRARICPAASARSPATASSRSAAQTVANVAWWVRWWLSVCATSASGTWRRRRSSSRPASRPSSPAVRGSSR